jgi:ribonuclease HII
MKKQYPSLDHELELVHAGHTHIAGLDEAGRGAWAGPVAAAAVILPLQDPSLPDQIKGVCDSKLCTRRQREHLYDVICTVAISWAVALVPAAFIDRQGIVPATRHAMGKAISQLDPEPDALLIDALDLPKVERYQRSIKKGDLKCLSVAAASILAKVTRDQAMISLDQKHPNYGFAAHKGYGTTQHREALVTCGPLSIHRWYFAPVAKAAEQLKMHPPHPVLMRVRNDTSR